MTRRTIVFLASAAVTIGIFAYLLSHVSVGAVVELLASADRRGVAMFCILSLTMSVLQAWRFRLLLAVSGHHPPGFPLLLIVLVRNLFADLLPARIGSLVYVYLVRDRLGIPLAPAAASFALSFLFDVIAQAPLLLLALLLASCGVAIASGSLAAFGVAVIVIGVALLFALPRLVGLVRVAPPFVGESLRSTWIEFVDRLREDLEGIAAAGIHSRVLLLSFLIRLAKYGALYVFLFALLSPRGYGLQDLDVARVLLGTMAAEAAASLPISGIAGFGAYEGTWATVFQMLGFPGDVAKLTSIAHHLFTQAWGYGLGAVAFVALLVWPVRRKARDTASATSFRATPWPRFALELTVLLVVSSTSLALAHELLGRTARAAPQPAAAPPPGERAALDRLAARFPGRIVFDSNRSGTFGIHTIAANGGDLRPLVDDGSQEMFPDPSPDGRSVVFARSASTWRMAPSEIWIVGADGSGARKLADDGTFPTFSADGTTVFFERGRAEVFALPVAGGTATRLFAPADFGFEGKEIVKPRVRPDGGGVLFTSDRGGRWNAWGVDLRSGQSFHLGDGCEPGWTHDPERVAWITNGKSGSAIHVFDLAAKKSTPLLDGDGPRGTEYFPTVTRDGRFLLYSASSPQRRSHVDGDFDLFVKDLASGEVLRLIHDDATDRWPKLLAGRGQT